MNSGCLGWWIPLTSLLWVIWRLSSEGMLPHYCPLFSPTLPLEVLFILMNAWAAYRQVSGLPTVTAHNTVNHSLNFVDPVSGTHTQNVESYWSRAKYKIKRMKGCHAHQLTSYLDEFMWRERYGRTAHQAFSNLMVEIAQQYPV